MDGSSALLARAHRTAKRHLRHCGRVGSTVSLVVCVTVDSGLDMIAGGLDPAAVHSDDDVVGFNRDVRVAVLQHQLELNYRRCALRVLPSYGQVMFETRIGQCDFGWSAFFMFPERESCVPNQNTCRSAAEVLPVGIPTGPRRQRLRTGHPYRCCYVLHVLHFDYRLQSPCSTATAWRLARRSQLLRSALPLSCVSWRAVLPCWSSPPPRE